MGEIRKKIQRKLDKNPSTANSAYTRPTVENMKLEPMCINTN